MNLKSHRELFETLVKNLKFLKIVKFLVFFKFFHTLKSKNNFEIVLQKFKKIQKIRFEILKTVNKNSKF